MGDFLTRDRISINLVESLPTVLDGNDNFRMLPRLIRKQERTALTRGRSRCFWLTVRAERDQPPGDYRGTVEIASEGSTRRVKLIVRVLPFLLPDNIAADFSMLETYEFYPLLEDRPAQERALITEYGRKVYQDYLSHGLNRVWPHSSYYFRRNPDGTPRLDELFTALQTAKELGLNRPVLWFCGSLVQTAKPKHPGNVRLYEPVLMKERMREIVRYVNHQVELNGWPEVMYEPSDEPADNADYPLDRGQQAKELLEVVKAEGGKTAETGTFGLAEGWLDLPVLGSQFDLASLKAARPNLPGWLYYSETITQNSNLSFTRYGWGFFPWRMGFDGISAWTFQNTMNAKGDPFTDLDGEGADVMVALPGTGGPIPTVYWESVREGIDDYRYISLLKSLIEVAPHGSPADSIAKLLESLRKQSLTSPTNQENQFGDWKPEQFDARRKMLVDWISILSPAEQRPRGDFNADGKLDLQDALRILSRLNEKVDDSALDLNGDGAENIVDVVWLLIQIVRGR
jgi:hypothetical protein